MVPPRALAVHELRTRDLILYVNFLRLNANTLTPPVERQQMSDPEAKLVAFEVARLGREAN